MFQAPGTLAFAQQTPPNGGTRLEIRVVGKRPPEPPKAEPGDNIRVDESTGELIAESRGVIIRLPNKAAELKADLDVAVQDTGSGILRYDYRLSNGVGAKRELSAVIIEVSDPQRVTASVEGGWAAIRKTFDGRVPSMIMVTKVTPDTDPRLAAGKATSFAFSSTDVPGMVKVRILPAFVFPKNDELTDGQFFDGASAWLRAKMLELDTTDRHEVTAYTLAPKVSPAEDSISRVQSEIRDASTLPPFHTISQELLAVSRMADPNQILAALRPLGGVPVQKAFVAAVTLRLNRLRQQ